MFICYILNEQHLSVSKTSNSHKIHQASQPASHRDGKLACLPMIELAGPSYFERACRRTNFFSDRFLLANIIINWRALSTSWKVYHLRARNTSQPLKHVAKRGGWGDIAEARREKRRGKGRDRLESSLAKQWSSIHFLDNIEFELWVVNCEL